MDDGIGRAPSGQALVNQAPAGLGPSGFDPSRIEWRTQTARYANGKDFVVSGVNVGAVFYDGMSSKSVPERYKIETRLPGFILKADRFATEGEAQRALEKFTLGWLTRMLPAIAMEARQRQDAKRLDPKGDSAAIAQPNPE